MPKYYYPKECDENDCFYVKKHNELLNIVDKLRSCKNCNNNHCRRIGTDWNKGACKAHMYEGET